MPNHFALLYPLPVVPRTRIDRRNFRTTVQIGGRICKFKCVQRNSSKFVAIIANYSRKADFLQLGQLIGSENARILIPKSGLKIWNYLKSIWHFSGTIC
uniref:Uncharacterized protein n=1 Tax=Romanomermis culicivorax TaxID=13658 RepID=A0A915I4P6_ROMCU